MIFGLDHLRDLQRGFICVCVISVLRIANGATQVSKKNIDTVAMVTESAPSSRPGEADQRRSVHLSAATNPAPQFRNSDSTRVMRLLRQERDAALKQIADTSGYEQAIADHKQTIALLGDTHPDVVGHYTQLGLLYRMAGDYEQAIAQYRKSLAIQRKAWGDDHPKVAAVYTQLGLAYVSTGHFDQAIAYHQQSLAIYRAALGDDHLEIGGVYNNLGLAHKAKGDYDQAITYYRRSLAIHRSVFGERHPSLGTLQANLGEVYHQRGDYDRAIALYHKSLNLWRTLLDKDHILFAFGYNKLGFSHEAKGEYGQAVAYWEQAVALLEKDSSYYPQTPLIKQRLHAARQKDHRHQARH